MKKKYIYLIIAITFLMILFISYWLFEASKFAKGVKEDVIKRDSFFKEKGIRLDSMGTVKYEDYQKTEDSLKGK